MFGTCTQEKVIKFIDVGLSKSEIVKLCSPAEKKPARQISAPANTKPPLKAKVAQYLKGNLADLNGIWTIEAICEPYSVTSDNIIVKNGKFSGILDGGDDYLYTRGDIDKDGTISGYGDGTYVSGELKGKIGD